MNTNYLEQGEHLAVIVSVVCPVAGFVVIWLLSKWFVRTGDFSKHRQDTHKTFEKHWEAIESGRQVQQQSEIKHHALLHELKALSISIQEHSQATKDNTNKTHELSERIAVLDALRKN